MKTNFENLILHNTYHPGKSGSLHPIRCLLMLRSMAIEIDPRYVMAHSNLGILHYRLGNWYQTLEDWEHALDMRRTMGDVQSEALTLSNLGQLLLLVDLPVFLRGQANASAIGATAIIGTAEG